MSIDAFGIIGYIIAVRCLVTGRLSIFGSTMVATVLPWVARGIYQGIMRLIHHTSFFMLPSATHLLGMGIQAIVTVFLFLYIQHLPDDDYVRWGGAVIVGILINYVFIPQLFVM